MFTRSERFVLIFLMSSLLIGSGITLYKRLNPTFAPELPIEILREVQRETQSIPDTDSSSQKEHTQSLEDTVVEESQDDLTELIQKTEKRLKGEYPAITVNINKASKRELMLLPRIGPKTAEKIIAYRETHGLFKKREDIMNVAGIGEKTYEKIKEMIVLE